MSHLTTSRGITLIELLVVVAILGILTSIGTIGYQSFVSGSNFGSNKTILLKYLQKVRFNAHADNKHYKVTLSNSSEDLLLKVYEPDSTNVKWRDLNLNRRCGCYSGVNTENSNCSNTFSNSAVSSLTSITEYDETLEGLNVKSCTSDSCSSPVSETVELCFLYDGSAPTTKYFKITGASDDTAIITHNKTGYVEEN